MTSNFETHRYEYLYLNALRESGDTNMFGAVPYLTNALNITEKEAKTVLLGWMAWVNENPNNANIF